MVVCGHAACQSIYSEQLSADPLTSVHVHVYGTCLESSVTMRVACILCMCLCVPDVHPVPAFLHVHLSPCVPTSVRLPLCDYGLLFAC